MEKISRLDKVTNKEVFRGVNKDRQILNSSWQRKHRWIGHSRIPACNKKQTNQREEKNSNTA